jgi:S1-C subfamily serine protease
MALALVAALTMLGVVVWTHSPAAMSARRSPRPPADAQAAPRPTDSDAAVLVLERAAQSIVRVVGSAPECGRPSIQGTGFVYAPERVMTTTHAVAGTRGALWVTADGDVPRQATVVLIDPRRDVAVLRVPGLAAPALYFDRTGTSGEDAVVAGFKKDTTSLSSLPARIRVEERPAGPDIYGQGMVVRRIYRIDADVTPGISGAPLLATNGSVYGMVFAADLDERRSGYALTTQEISTSAEEGRTRTREVSTGECSG